MNPTKVEERRTQRFLYPFHSMHPGSIGSDISLASGSGPDTREEGAACRGCHRPASLGACFSALCTSPCVGLQHRINGDSYIYTRNLFRPACSVFDSKTLQGRRWMTAKFSDAWQLVCPTTASRTKHLSRRQCRALCQLRLSLALHMPEPQISKKLRRPALQLRPSTFLRLHPLKPLLSLTQTPWRQPMGQGRLLKVTLGP